MTIDSKWKAFILVAVIALMSPAASLFAQCPSSCPTADDAEIQSMINAVAVSGGVVQLAARIYVTCKPIILPSNVHLRGAGRGATIILGSGTITAETVDKSYVVATIATVKSKNVTVSDLTIDHATCQRHANGIAFLPAGTSLTNIEAYDGEVSKNGLVERVEVLGHPGVHSYMIWNMRGQHMKIVDNWVDGNTLSPPTTPSAQEGIETYGGSDVLISGNTVKNIGNACLNVGSGGAANSGTSNVTASNNYLTNCQVGVNLATANASNGAQNQVATQVIGNVIAGARATGIDVAVTPGTEERHLLIANNTIRDMSGSGVVGIYFRANGGTLASTAVTANTVIGNQLDNITGANAHGVRIWGYYNVRVLENTLTLDNATASANAGVYIVDSSNVDVTANRFYNTGYSAVQVWKSAVQPQRLVVDRNYIHWNGASGGIFMSGVRYATAKDNVFQRDGNSMINPVHIPVGCDVTVEGNVAWYFPTWTFGQPSGCS